MGGYAILDEKNQGYLIFNLYNLKGISLAT